MVHADHKNLTDKVFNTERVMHWRLILEEHGPELHHAKGKNNVVADTLSCLELEPRLKSKQDDSVFETPGFPLPAEAFGCDNDDTP